MIHEAKKFSVHRGVSVHWLHEWPVYEAGSVHWPHSRVYIINNILFRFFLLFTNIVTSISTICEEKNNSCLYS